jgi:hypothetical protein
MTIESRHTPTGRHIRSKGLIQVLSPARHEGWSDDVRSWGKAHCASGRAKRRFLRLIRGLATLLVGTSAAFPQGTNNNGIAHEIK